MIFKELIMNKLICLLLLVTAPVAFAQRTNPPRSARPNILLITADDLGIQAGCYGDALARTPRLDQLAREGVRFANAFVTAASCSPSRSSILTGLYPPQNGQLGLAHLGFSMHDTVQTLPARLKQAGYRTGIIGKLHVQPEKNFPFDFEFAKHDANKTREVRAVADSAATFIRQAGTEPFFLMVNYFDPHTKLFPQVAGLPEKPYQPGAVKPLPFQGVDAPAERERIADFYSCIARLDIGLGMLLDALQVSGQADNTLVIFIGDHGAPFVRGKTSCYEAGLQIPFVVRWPGHVQPGTVTPRLISTVDIVPTALEAAGLPRSPNLAGQSLMSLFRDKKAPWRTQLFGEFFYHGPESYYPRYSVRNDRYKLILNLLHQKTNPVLGVDGDPAYRITQQPEFDNAAIKIVFDRYANPPEYELYDLAKDPQEFTNLGTDPAHTVQLNELKKSLQDWMFRTKAPLPDKR